MKVNSSGVRIVDKGWNKLIKAVADVGNKKLKVGVVGSEAQNESEEGGITMARLAGVHEYGAVIRVGDGEIIIPERSFIRSTIIKHKYYSDEIVKLLRSVLRGNRIEEEALKLLGERVVADIKQNIAQGIDPPNAASTIAKKNSSKPLIDTGRLRNSITYVVVSDDE